MNDDQRVPVEAHRVAQHQLRFQGLESEVPAARPAVANQSVDVVRQTQQLAVDIFQLKIQKVAAALEAVDALLHINNSDQRKPPTATIRNKKYDKDNSNNFQSQHCIEIVQLRTSYTENGIILQNLVDSCEFHFIVHVITYLNKCA